MRSSWMQSAIFEVKASLQMMFILKKEEKKVKIKSELL